jgi:hypothetical protein
MRQTNNYYLQMQQAKKHFLTYDQEKIIKKFSFPYDESYLYPVMVGETYRLCRRTGALERKTPEGWTDANEYNPVMTLLDLLCDSKDTRHLAGRWLLMQNFGLQFHQKLLEEQPDPLARSIHKNPDAFHRACLALGGRPVPGGDISYAIELMDSLCVCLRFWFGDEEFTPQLCYFWDENATMYLRYETMYFALGLVKERLLFHAPVLK